MLTLNDFLTFLESPESASPSVAFIWGVLLTLVVILFLLFWIWVRQRRKQQGFTISIENGDLKMTENAIKEFVFRVASEHTEASMRWVRIKTTSSGGLHLQISLALIPGTAIVPLVEKLREQLQREARRELGIQEDMRIDVTVNSLSAKKT